VSLDLLATERRRQLLFGLLYLSEGAPIGYLWWAIPTRLRAAGVPVEDVAAFGAALTVPWALKFLWAPLVDAGRSRRFGLRPWIVSAQLLMGLTLLPLAFSADLAASYRALYPVLLAHAVCAATQDVAIDAMAVRRIPVPERGRATAWMQLGMLGGRAVFGGAALALEGWVGARAVVLLLVGAIAASAVVALLARDSGDVHDRSNLAARAAWFGRRLTAVVRHESTWLGLAFATLVGAGMEATGALAGPLLVDRGFSSGEVGRFFAGPAVLTMGIGVLAGGWLSDRLRRQRAVVVSVLTLAAVVVAVATSASVASAGPRWPLLLALACAYVAFGMVTSASYTLLMDLTEPELGGTQFSAYMGAVNLCYVWSAWTAGWLAGRFDYPTALLAMALASLLALALLPALGRRRG
jgi:MFS transporter, PAT family, beta-lactamase induction signal transducer AmpG